jgi:hypothetical protein
VVLCAGDHDRIVERADVERLHAAWPGSEFFTVPQGHFGYRMMNEMWARLTANGRL